MQAADERGQVALIRPWEPAWKAPSMYWKLSERAPEAFSGPAGPYAFHYPHVTEMSSRGPLLSCGGGSWVFWKVDAP